MAYTYCVPMNTYQVIFPSNKDYFQENIKEIVLVWEGKLFKYFRNGILANHRIFTKLIQDAKVKREN